MTTLAPGDTSTRAHAMAYLARGWKVFALSSSKKPLRNCDACDTSCPTPEAKEVCGCLTCHGFYSATSDENKVDAMFMANRDRCLAVRTGAPSQIMVVDVDGPEGVTTMRELIADGLLPRTLTARTGSGGYHLVYRHPGGHVMSGAGKVGHKVDSKADGGYIVAPPSVHPRTGDRYAWLDWTVPIAEPPRALVDRLRPEEVPPPRPRTFGRHATTRTHGRLVGLVNQVLEAPEGNGNNCLYWAACRAGEMVARGEISEDQAHAALYEAATSIGIKPGDAGRDPRHGTIGSGLKRGQR